MSQKFQYILDFVAQTEKFQKEVGGLKGTLKSVGVAAAAYFSVDAILDFGKAAVTAYNESAQSEAALLTALKGRSDIQGRLIEQAGQLQGKTLFEDDETIRAQSLVAAFIKEENAIKSIIPVIQDFAAAKQMDLAGAADLVTKTIAGEMNALGRYGIQVEGAAGSAERLASVQKGLNDAFGGQAVAAAKAGVGALVLLKNAYGDLLETIGGGGSETINENARFITALVNMINGKLKDGLAERETDEQAMNKRLKESSVEQLQALVKTKMDAADLYLSYYKRAVDEENKVERAKWSMKYSAAKQSIDQITKEIELRKNAEKAQTTETGSVAGLAEQLKALNEQLGNTNVSDTTAIKLIGAKTFAINEQIRKIEELKEAGAKAARDSLNDNPSLPALTPKKAISVNDGKSEGSGKDPHIAALASMGFYLDANAKKAQKLKDEIAQTRADRINELAGSFSSLGDSIGGAAGNFLSMVGNVLGMIPTLIAQITALTTTQVASSAAVSSAKSGEAMTSGIAASQAVPFPLNIIALAATLAAVGGAIASVAFADGGIVSGPTHALVGEYPGASSNPEVIAPLSKLKALIAPSGGSTIILQPSLEMDGDKFRVMIKRLEQKAQKRT